jgi:peptide-methionine (S)-S-oxide reductase
MMEQIATFGAGCFWGVEALFAAKKGVIETSVGYMGGHTPEVDYQAICQGDTGHAEVVQLSFDDSVITYEDLLLFFWGNHNPTTPNQQGPDFGTQYRSVIFYHSESQKEQAEAMLAALTQNGVFNAPIVTIIEPAAKYHLGEEYHQKYLLKRGQASCSL